MLFPMHPDLRHVGMSSSTRVRMNDVVAMVMLYIGLLNPLDTPHHMRQDVHAPYREGVVLEEVGIKGKAMVDCGLKEVCRCMP